MKPAEKRKPPSLLELAKQTAIANIRYMGDIGETDIYLLKDILPHATPDQLMHIEKSTVGRDLSEVTNDLWKRYYKNAFGEENVNLVVERMRKSRVSFSWRQLYEAKKDEREKASQRSVEKFKQRFAEDLARKQSRQTQPTTKVPPSSRKRGFAGGSGSCSNFSNLKSNLLKKAKVESVNSHEARIHATMRKNAVQRNSFPVQNTTLRKSFPPQSFLNRGITSTVASSSKLAKPLPRSAATQAKSFLNRGTASSPATSSKLAKPLPRR